MLKGIFPNCLSATKFIFSNNAYYNGAEFGSDGFSFRPVDRDVAANCFD